MTNEEVNKRDRRDWRGGMNLKQRIKENDNRFTTQPYLLLLQEKVVHVVPEGYGHNSTLKYIEDMTGEQEQFDSKDEAVKFLIDYGYSLEEQEIREVWIDYSWNTINVFLTDKGLQEHLDLNRHNLSEWRSFGIHAFRNPEFDEVFKLIMSEETQIEKIGQGSF